MKSGIPNMLKLIPQGSFTSSRSLTFIVVASLGLLFPAMATAENVLIETPLGDIEIELLEEDAPNTVANFLNYMDNDLYDKSVVHRIVPGFVIQGGGFTFDTGTMSDIPSFPTIENEFKVSNTRGTVAMAKLPGDPDSASSEWFINLADNSANLDIDNGGYAVFARVVAGMDVVDAISLLPNWDATSVFGSAFIDLPLIDFVNDGRAVADENIVFADVTETDVGGTMPFAMNAGLNDAWYNPVTDGQGFFVTVYPDRQRVFLSWFTFDTELPAEDASANLGDPGHRWLTASGSIEGNRSEMTIYITSGGLFDNNAIVENVVDGTITLTFEDCATGLVEYDITSINKQGSVPIQRIALDNQALCEALAAPVDN
jgi:peptidyl-prolyl cis-trans isomerase A (cyclophilin A)